MAKVAYDTEVADWAVEVLNDLVAVELLSLPTDMQARFLRISEQLESSRPQAKFKQGPAAIRPPL